MGLNGYFISKSDDDFMFSVPFLLAGGIKTFYDIALGICFLWGKKSQKDIEHVDLVEVTNE